MQKLFLALAAIGLASALTPMAFADSYTQNVTSNNPYGDALSCTPTACTGPYATLTVDLTSSTTATVTVTALSNSTNQYLIGDDSEAMAFDVNAGSFTATDFSFTGLSGFTQVGYTGKDTGLTGYDDSGEFNLAIYSSPEETGFSNASDEISFVITDTSGTWASAYDVLTSSGNGFGFDGAIEAYACPVSACTTTSEEGHGVLDVQPTPEPGSLALLGTGVLGLAGIVRRKLRR